MRRKFTLRLILKVTSLAFLIGLVIDACTDPQLHSSNATAGTAIVPGDETVARTINDSNPFQKNVGAPIDKQTAHEWIDNYRKVTGSSFEYFIDAQVIKDILAQSGCNGISMRYGADTEGRLHIIPVGVDTSGREIKTVQIITMDGDIDWETSKSMITRYKGDIVSFYFGSDTFGRLFQNKECRAVHATAALDGNGKPQLLLNDNISFESSTFEDVSRPCPPYCEDQF